MSGEGKITVNQLKVILEGVDSRIRTLTEVISHRFDQNDREHISIKETLGKLLEGQTEIKYDLKRKATFEEFENLEKRVSKLENRVA